MPAACAPRVCPVLDSPAGGDTLLALSLWVTPGAAGLSEDWPRPCGGINVEFSWGSIASSEKW